MELNILVFIYRTEIHRESAEPDRFYPGKVVAGGDLQEELINY